MAVCLFSGSSFAQGKDKKAKETKTAQSDTKKTDNKGTKLKKDGSPDMRYKENKEKKAAEAIKPAGPVKKDGTPDMRHKANKEAKDKK